MNYVLIYNQNRKKRSEKLLFLFAKFSICFDEKFSVFVVISLFLEYFISFDMF